MEITVATWNIAGGKPIRDMKSFSYKDEDYLDENAEYFGNKLRNLNPDIICLQETHLGSNKSLAKEIGEIVGDYHCVEYGTSRSHIDDRYQMGNAILSKKIPLSDEFHLFPYPDFPLSLPNGKTLTVHNKGFQVLKYDFGNVVNLHMQPLRFLGTPYDSPNGQAYAKEIEGELEKYVSQPLIMMGDFNYGKCEDLYSNLVGNLSLRNALPDTSTRPDQKATDYIFNSPEFEVVDQGIEQTNTDHYLCWAKLKIEI